MSKRSRSKKSKSSSKVRSKSASRGRSRTRATVQPAMPNNVRLRMLDKDFVTSSLALITPPTGLAAANLINGFKQGSGNHERQGNRILLKTLTVKGRLVQPPYILAAGAFVRLMIVYDESPNGAACLSSDFLGGTDYAGTALPSAALPYSGLPQAASSRFKIIRDQKFSMGAQGAAASTAQLAIPFAQQWEIDWYIRLNMLESQYLTADGNAVTAVGTGALYIVLVSDAASGTYFLGTTRLRAFDA